MEITEQDGYFSVTDYLKHYKTPGNQISTLKQYLCLIYPKYADELKPKLKKDCIPLLDKLGKQYITECKNGRNWQNDLLTYKKNPIIGKGGSINSKISRVRVWLEWNDLTLSPRWTRSLFNPSTNRTTSSYAPTIEEISKIIQHLDLPYKTLTLVLTSSGARCGSEAMKWKLNDIDWTHNPVRIYQVPSRPPKNRSPFIFI